MQLVYLVQVVPIDVASDWHLGNNMTNERAISSRLTPVTMNPNIVDKEFSLISIR